MRLDLDLDLVREILLRLESLEGAVTDANPRFEGTEPRVVGYHVWLLAEAGLVVLRQSTVGVSFRVTPEGTVSHLTWDGHQFCALCREQSIWEAFTQNLAYEWSTFEIAKWWLEREVKARLAATDGATGDG